MISSCSREWIMAWSRGMRRVSRPHRTKSGFEGEPGAEGECPRRRPPRIEQNVDKLPFVEIHFGIGSAKKQEENEETQG